MAAGRGCGKGGRGGSRAALGGCGGVGIPFMPPQVTAARVFGHACRSAASARGAKWWLRNRANTHVISFCSKVHPSAARDALDTGGHVRSFKDDNAVESIIRERKGRLECLRSVTYEGV